MCLKSDASNLSIDSFLKKGTQTFIDFRQLLHPRHRLMTSILSNNYVPFEHFVDSSAQISFLVDDSKNIFNADDALP